MYPYHPPKITDFLKVSCEPVHYFVTNPTDGRTDKQTNRQKTPKCFRVDNNTLGLFFDLTWIFMKPFYLRNVFRLQLICVLLSIIHVSLSALLALVNLFRNFVEDIVKFHGI